MPSLRKIWLMKYAIAYIFNAESVSLIGMLAAKQAAIWTQAYLGMSESWTYISAHNESLSLTSKRQSSWWAKYINRKLTKARKKTCTRYEYKRKVRHITTQINNNLKVLSSDLSLSILFSSWVCITLFTVIMFFVLFCFLYRYSDDFNPLTPHIVYISILG